MTSVSLFRPSARELPCETEGVSLLHFATVLDFALCEIDASLGSRVPFDPHPS